MTFDDAAGVERALRQAGHILGVQGRPGLEEWLLIATNAGEADLAMDRLAPDDAARLRPMLDELMRDLRDQTDNFRDPEFLSLTRAARRRNPALFQP